jgi:hypothetical protein
MPEGAVAIRHRCQPDMGDIVQKRHWCLVQAIRERHVGIGHGEQKFAQLGAISKVKFTHAANLV